jgi:quercetin dioxygenase-like cupin family protein
MQILRPDPDGADQIAGRPYETTLARSTKLAEGQGEAHAYVVYLEPGGVIAPHEAGFGQLFVALRGRGWVAGDDGRRLPLDEGEVAFVHRGEVHSKGSETGTTALMVQVRELAPLRD